MTADSPLAFRWSGEALEPLTSRWQKECDKRLVVGEQYLFAEVQERSALSHRHYFAAINEAWANLPESLADQYPTAEALRKKTLIKAGYRDERSIVCSSKAEAERIAAFISPMDTYAVVIVRGNVVIVYTAKSQSYRAMSKGDFQKSKDDTLAFISDLIGTTKKELEGASA